MQIITSFRYTSRRAPLAVVSARDDREHLQLIPLFTVAYRARIDRCDDLRHTQIAEGLCMLIRKNYDHRPRIVPEAEVQVALSDVDHCIVLGLLISKVASDCGEGLRKRDRVDEAYFYARRLVSPSAWNID